MIFSGASCNSEDSRVIETVSEVESAVKGNDKTAFEDRLSTRSLDAMKQKTRKESNVKQLFDVPFFMEIMKDTIPWTIGKVKVNGDVALASITDGHGEEIKLTLVREDGVWKLDLSSEHEDWELWLRKISDRLENMQKNAPILEGP